MLADGEGRDADEADEVGQRDLSGGAEVSLEEGEAGCDEEEWQASLYGASGLAVIRAERTADPVFGWAVLLQQ
jgi:hypothetical protein